MSNAPLRRWVAAAGGLFVLCALTACGHATDPRLAVATDASYRGWWLALDIPGPTKPKPNGVIDTITLAGDAEFAPEQVVLSPGSVADMSTLAKRLLETSGGIWIAGHTAITSTPDANVEFSRRRASSVLAALTTLHVPAQRLHIVGCGQAYPQSEGPSPSDQARNRIVVVRVSLKPLSQAAACEPVPGR